MERAAAVIIRKDGKVLALRRSKDASSFQGFWNFPGGGIEKGETPEEAAAREVKEESGLDVNPDKLKSLGDYEFPYLHIYYFEAKSFSGEVEINHESTEFKWIKPKEMLEMIFLPMPTDLLGKVINK